MHSSISEIIPIYGNSFVAASHSFWPKVHLRGFALVNHPVIFTIWRAPLPLSKGFSVIYYLWSLTDCLHIGVFSSLLPWEASEVLGSKIYRHFVKTLIFKKLHVCSLALTYLIIDLVYMTTLWLYSVHTIYRVSHSKVNKVILLWWGYRFQFLLIFWILRVHGIGAFMPNSSVFIFLMLHALYRMIRKNPKLFVV